MMLGWILAIACTLTACLGQERRAMGFMGVRGKKDGEGGGAPTGLTVESSEASSGFLDDDHSSLSGVMAPLHSGQFLLTDKRGPSYMGFQGVRGKKDGELQSPVMFDSDGAVLLASPYGGYDEWKRAPSMGFQGVRGKKTPMGFTGVRGKKDEYSWIEEDKRAPAAGFFGVRGKKGPSSSSFFGMRGKKGPSSSSFFGMRGKRGQNDQQQPEDIEALLQALKDSSLRQDFNGMMDSRVKRLASPAEDSEASPKTNSMQ